MQSLNIVLRRKLFDGSSWSDKFRIFSFTVETLGWPTSILISKVWCGY